jgi:hypothetical protein
MADNSLFRFPRLKGSQNWEFWALRMEAFVIDKGYDLALYPVVPYDKETGTTQDYEVYLKDRGTKSQRAAALIRLAVEDGPLIQIKGLKDAISIWDRLQQLYEPKGFSSEFLLCKELFATTLSGCSNSIETYLTRIKRLSDELASRDLAIPTKVIVAYALNNLTRDYEQCVAIITQSLRTSDKEIELNAIFSYLIDEARRLRSLEPQEMAMSTNQKDTQKPKCAHCKRIGHNQEKCWEKYPNLKPKKAKNGQNKAKNGQNGAINSTTKPTENTQTTLFTQDEGQLVENEEYALSTIDLHNSDVWVLDSGATRHICAYKSLFSDLRPYKTVLNWGKATNIPVNWVGTVKIKFGSTGRTAKIENCLYVPEMGLNLLSLGLLRQKGVFINIGLKSVSLSIGKDEIAKGYYKRNLIIISTAPQNEYASIATTINTWHERMGHMGATALKLLPEKATGCDLNPKEVKNTSECEICIQAKATRKVSRVEMPRASTILEKVHSDICGPIAPESLSKKRYFVSFIDDKTRWATTKLLSSRDKLFTEFNSYIKEEETQLDAKLKRLHSDNAPEYKSDEFKALFNEKGAIATYSAPYTPEQNGVSERFNRTIMNKVRAMLILSGAPKSLWGEAVQTATYIYNRTPNSSLQGYISPYEARTGQKPDISNIRTFGSIAYKKEPKEFLKKLDPRASPYILIGYGQNQYRLIKPGSKKTSMARDVDILERVFIKDLPKRLEAKLAKINAQTEAIWKEPLLFPENDPIQQNNIEDNWLKSFYNELEENARIDEEFALLATDPTYKEAMASAEAQKWKEACLIEYNTLKSKNTWTLVPRTRDLKVIDGKWVLKIKDPYRVPLYKARWVARGFQQQYGVDFFETFANTVNTTAWRLILAIAGYLDWEIKQWDVKSAFPNANLKEKVYIEQPMGFIDPEKPDWVYQLNRALYGLKQSGREWELHLKGLLEARGLYPLKTDQSIYLNKTGDLILMAYVDDLIVLSPKNDKIKSLYNQLAQSIELKDLGNIDEFLGIKIQRNREKRTISLDQRHYIDKILIKFGHQSRDKKAQKTRSPIPIGAKIEPLDETQDPEVTRKYQQQIGALMYLTTKTRPDLAFSIGYLARYMSNPGPAHFKLLDKVWEYLANTPSLGLWNHSNSNSIECYVDADWGGDIGTRRSTTGYIFLFRGTPISWNSKLQRTVALSSCEAEYMAIKEAIKEQQYIKAILSELAPIFTAKTAIECLDIYTDSNSAIELAKNPIYHARTKHIDIQYHYIRECIQKGVSKLIWVPTKGQLADGLTKAISNDKWTQFITGIGLKDL